MEKFVLVLPEWEDKLQFSQEWVTLILVVITFVAGIVLTFLGYRYFRKIMPVIVGAVCGRAGYHIIAQITENRIVQMYIFVVVMFLSVCICCMVTVLWTYILKKLELDALFQRYLYMISALTGALISGFVLWQWIFADWVVALCCAVILMGLGVWYGWQGMKRTRVFYTYEDLAKMKPDDGRIEDA